MRHWHVLGAALLLALPALAQPTQTGTQAHGPFDGSGQNLTPDGTAAHPFNVTSPPGGSTTTAPAQVTPAAPDASTVPTGGTAVQAFTAGHVAKGGFLVNPAAATAPLCIALNAPATTTASGATSCIAAGQTYTIPAMAGYVSANATDSGHAFSGTGYQ